MGKQKIVEYFEEVEASREYSGYFCSIPEAISIVVLGSMRGLHIPQQMWAGFLEKKSGRIYAVLAQSRQNLRKKGLKPKSGITISPAAALPP